MQKKSMYETELMHHGIPGQKWGVKHGPPYPLDAKVSRGIRIERKQDRNRSFIRNTLDNSDELKNQKRQARIADLDTISTNGRSDLYNNALMVNRRSDRGKLGRVFNCQNCSAAFEMRMRGYDVAARMREDASNVYHPEKWFDGGSFEMSDEYKDPFYKKEYPKDKKEQAEFLNEYVSHCDRAFSNFCKDLENQGRGARGIVVVGWVNSMSKLAKRTNEFHAFNYVVDSDKKVKFIDAEGETELVQSKKDWLSQKEPSYYGFGDDWYIKDRGPSMHLFVDPREWSYMRTDTLNPNDSIMDAVISRKLVDKE